MKKVKVLIILFMLILKASTLKKQKSTSNTGSDLSKSHLQQERANQVIERSQRILATVGQPFTIDYTITKFLKMYDSRKSYCLYLCQSDSLLAFSQVWTCYSKYNCSSLIWEDISIGIIIVLYLIVPIFMILTGIWKTRCLGRQIALLTGIVCLNTLYQKLSTQFQQSMETDYQISTQNATSQQKTSEGSQG